MVPYNGESRNKAIDISVFSSGGSLELLHLLRLESRIMLHINYNGLDVSECILDHNIYFFKNFGGK